MAEQSNRISAVNSFESGLVTDLHNLTSPSNTVTDALNMELVTEGANQYIFQNIRGNTLKVEMPLHYDATLDESFMFIPLGLKVNNNIAYILAGAFTDDGTFLAGTVGTYPSPNWEYINANPTLHKELEDNFKPLHNFKNTDLEDPIHPFISSEFKFEKNRYIDVDIQGDFDGSVNIIFSDSLNNPRIINSRFKKISSSNSVQLADRSGNNDSNTYSDNDWDRIALIQNTNFPIEIASPAYSSKGATVLKGGYLRGGGYRYYFKYTTQEGNSSEILYESGLIPIASDSLGLDKDQISDKQVRFILTNLDSSYTGISVFFAHSSGYKDVQTEFFKINYVFSYTNQTSLVITHTGLEDVTPVDVSDINTTFTPIDTITSAVVISDRLAMAGASSTLAQSDLDILAQASKDITLWEDTMSIPKSYADPEVAANLLGYWKGEVYEFAAVYMLKNKGLSPAFPVTGMDNFLGDQQTNIRFIGADNNLEYPDDCVIEEDGFENTTLINNKGLYRVSNTGDIYTPDPNSDNGTRHITYLKADVRKLHPDNNPELSRISTGFFIVRRKRIKNVLMQGMAVPTIKLPSKSPSVSLEADPKQNSMASNKRYLMMHWGHFLNTPENFPTLGLNAKYSTTDDGGDSRADVDFDVVHVPQPTQLLNVLTFKESHSVYGSIGQEIRDENSPELISPYGETIDRTGVASNKMHIALYGCELDLNMPAIESYINGINPEIEIQSAAGNISPIAKTHLHSTFSNSGKTTIVKLLDPVSMGDYSAWHKVPAKFLKAFILKSGIPSYADGSFSAKTDRALGLFSADKIDTGYTEDAVHYVHGLTRTTVFSSAIDVNIMTSDAAFMPSTTGFAYNYIKPYSIISQSYSAYIGITITDLQGLTEVATPPVFYYKDSYTAEKESYSRTAALGDLLWDSAEAAYRYYVNIGHLVNVFRSSEGRWGQDDIKNIYKYDSNKAYYAVTERYSFDDILDYTITTFDSYTPYVNYNPQTSGFVNIFRGDAFISRIYKRVTYKNGIPESKSATSSDAGSFGLGIINQRTNSTDLASIDVEERDDKGRNLFDLGQIIELATFSNINADIRSIESISEEEDLLYGGPRDFYPNKEGMFSDARPDSSAYNHGYTGEDNPIAYFRIEENSPSFNTEFPNRILLSERNVTQNFFNSFRNIKGFNFRDYGVELGPIIKLAAIKNILLSIHPTGVLAIGVDEKTLVSEDSNVYVNTAESLSPNSKKISDVYGSVNPESIVKTDTSIAGVDYNANVIWIFQGDALNIISEFSIRTLLDTFKNKITNKTFEGAEPGAAYTARVYSTFNNIKHTLYVSYVAENTETKKQFHIGTVSYSTVLQKWMSQLSEGNKFSFFLSSKVYTTGFTAIKNTTNELGEEISTEQDDYGIWQEDSSSKRVFIRGKQYEHYFEVVVNKEPSLEKVLTNLRMICNKSIPVDIVYTTSGDENDAAIDIWPDTESNKTLTQKIITRNKSPRKSLRLGILDENAYYKNSGLYIEVSKINSVTRKSAGNKRVRDKSIKIKIRYAGDNETFIQALISLLTISHS